MNDSISIYEKIYINSNNTKDKEVEILRLEKIYGYVFNLIKKTHDSCKYFSLTNEKINRIITEAINFEKEYSTEKTNSQLSSIFEYYEKILEFAKIKNEDITILPFMFFSFNFNIVNLFGMANCGLKSFLNSHMDNIISIYVGFCDYFNIKFNETPYNNISHITTLINKKNNRLKNIFNKNKLDITSKQFSSLEEEINYVKNSYNILNTNKEELLLLEINFYFSVMEELILDYEKNRNHVDCLLIQIKSTMTNFAEKNNHI